MLDFLEKLRWLVDEENKFKGAFHGVIRIEYFSGVTKNKGGIFFEKKEIITNYKSRVIKKNYKSSNISHIEIISFFVIII